MALLLSPTSEAARRTRAPAYLVAGLMFLIPLIEIAVNAFPYRIHDPGWRIAFVSTAAGVSVTILLGLLVVYLVGVFAEDRPTNWIVAIVTAVMVVFCVVGAGTFVLDALQMRATVKPELEARYNVASAWGLAKIFFAALGASVLSLNAFRNARALRRVRDRGGKKAPAVVVSSATPIVGMPAPKQVGARPQILAPDATSTTATGPREL